jgi:hypothetical protein
VSLLRRIAPNLYETYEIPFNRSDPQADWDDAQKGVDSPYSSISIAHVDVGPPNDSGGPLQHSGTSADFQTATEPYHEILKRPSDLHHSDDATQDEHDFEKQLVKRLKGEKVRVEEPSHLSSERKLKIIEKAIKTAGKSPHASEDDLR